MSLREQFESRFPVPAGVAWSEERQNYGWIKKSAFQRTITYRALWTGWQESRAALVVELPAMPKVQRSDEEAVFSAGGCDMLRKCAKAIEAAGVKVTP